ncbi:hypothetical protein GAYE_SCF31G4910 [Galdieria yellowstonensis]|uniref:Uncharacterized protein n=1 Tax=Galdieria yellowstonensis TaxID=3028027 RepID=A0AAV9IHV4_9RHOD|nr:hypothetical protein GAYE_SCF31G4910 [Galdieria yellowstonensis]
MTRMFGSWFKFDKRKHLLLLLTNKKVQGQIVDKREGKVEITVTSIQKSLLPGGKRPVNEYACANMESARKVGEELASFAERHQIRELWFFPPRPRGGKVKEFSEPFIRRGIRLLDF